jgi:site-specific recombinase XerD
MRSQTLPVQMTGPLAEFAPGFAEELSRQGYAHLSALNQVRVLAHLSRWLVAQELLLSELTQARLVEFLAARREAGYTCWLSELGLAPLVGYLVSLGAMPAPERPAKESVVDRLLETYSRYLVAERGVTMGTVAGYRSAVRPFLEERVRGGRLELWSLVAADVTRFVLGACQRLEVGSAKYLVTALRSLLRYLHLEGKAPDLVAAVPGVAGWRGGQLPRGLESQQVSRLLASCERGTVVGRRDYAMLTLLARLGLRAVEVARLELEDLDWQSGEVVIRGKGDRQERLPLPTDVGEAVVNYLTQGRPQVECRRLFISVQAPLGGLSSGAVQGVVGHACDRTGMARVGAHRLRHTLATELLRAGATLPDVGQILRHRTLSNTALYAKVDRAALRELAQSWPARSTTAEVDRTALRGLVQPWPRGLA